MLSIPDVRSRALTRRRAPGLSARFPCRAGWGPPFCMNPAPLASSGGIHEDSVQRKNTAGASQCVQREKRCVETHHRKLTLLMGAHDVTRRLKNPESLSLIASVLGTLCPLPPQWLGRRRPGRRCSLHPLRGGRFPSTACVRGGVCFPRTHWDTALPSWRCCVAW